MNRHNPDMETSLPRVTSDVFPKKRAFFYHYNKPASMQKGRPQISVHYNGTCYIVDSLFCAAAVNSRARKTQPRFVMAGVGRVYVSHDKLNQTLNAAITA